MEIELRFLDWLQTIHNPVLDAIMVFITTLGDAGIVWIIFAIILCIIPKTRKAGVTLGIALLFDVIICNLILKNAVARTRPFEYREGLELLVKRPNDYSFPSGHTAASFACITGLLLVKEKKLFIGALIVGVLIAFSRLYIYVHFPTDILGGIVVGIVSGLGGWLIARRFKKLDYQLKKNASNNK